MNPRQTADTMKSYRHPSVQSVKLTTVFAALSDPERLKIVRHLLAGEGRAYACNEFPLKIAKATCSHHFSVLRKAGLIQTRTVGTKHMTTLRHAEIEKRFPGLLALVEG